MMLENDVTPDPYTYWYEAHLDHPYRGPIHLRVYPVVTESPSNTLRKANRLVSYYKDRGYRVVSQNRHKLTGADVNSVTNISDSVTK